MADIARRLNISRATVSYVLNERESEIISDSTRKRVLATAREMGYRPNRAAQALAGKCSYLIELFVHGYYPAFYAQVLHHFEQQIGPTPYQLRIVDPNYWTANNWKSVDSGWPVDGIIIFDAALPAQAIAELQKGRVPLVSAGIYPHGDVDHVRVDLKPALQEAVQYLVTRGKRVAYVSPWPADSPMAQRDPRYPAYRHAVREAGLREEIIVAPDGTGLQTRPVAREAVRDHIQKTGCPDAIFCFNDERAIATLTALRDLKIRVPEDVAIIGCDGIEEAAYHCPALSTIKYPVPETARLAWELLEKRLQTPDLPTQSATLTARLVLTESAGREVSTER
jgi:DNA-binding LacI/PurR family transcriptional regulator